MRPSPLVVLVIAAAAPLLASGSASAVPAPLTLNMASAFDTDCTQERGAEIVTGNCQNSPYAESFITSDAVAPGFPTGTVTFRKNPFVMGDPAMTAKNAANGKGQVVPTGAKTAYAYLDVLCNHVTGGGKKGGAVTITYTDRSTAKLVLMTKDWGGSPPDAVWSGGIQGALHPPAGTDTSSMFLEELPLDPHKVVASVTLPTFDGLRVFAMTLTSTSGAVKGPIFH